MKARQLKEKFINFFVSKGHVEIPSASLIPQNDPTTLFTSAGMQPMMPYLLGEKHPLGNKIVNSQKCFRSQDIEEVGDNRHTTFFEMLGNWSFGDYFKEEQLNYFFTFLTDKNLGLGLDPSRIYVSVFDGDPSQKVWVNGLNQPLCPDVETISIWKKLFKNFNLDAKDSERIFAYSADKNWWSRFGTPDKMPVGEPGGPDSEVFYDFGPELKLHENSRWKDQPCHVNCDCGRFLEIGNSVFMQYIKQENGSLIELPKKNIDFGGGLSRLEAAFRNDPDIFNISTFKPIIDKIENISGCSYLDPKNQSAMRIIADHLTAAVFIIADGIEPSNKEAGYILRRLIRRSIVKARNTLKIETNFTSKIARAVLNNQSNYGGQYPELGQNCDKILSILETEENKFRQTLEKGIHSLKKIFSRAIGGIDPENPGGMVIKGNVMRINGYELFKIYETYGLPIEISEEVMKDWGVAFDDQTQMEAQEAFIQHQQQSRTLSAGKFKSGLADNSETITKLHTTAHLLHAALRKILGNHVKQAGSNITTERIRFDFTNPEKLTEDQIKKISDLINQQINKSLPITKETMPFVEAQKQGALAFFGNKYPEIVSVYTVGDFSKEVCTGPHVDNTKKLGKFEIIKEESAGSGKRRIYAVLK